MTSVTDPNNQTVNYTYDSLKRMTAVQAAADGKTYKNAYVYADDKLSQVSHNTTDDANCDVQYNFAYDAAARPLNVKVGAQTLSSNTYNADGTLQKVTFGNGQTVNYAYDGYKRTTGLSYSSGGSYSYQYGANGQVAEVRDNSLNRTAQSEYDTANRPMRVRHMEGSAHLYTGEVEYDGQNNLKTFKEKVGVTRTAYQTDFAYDVENKPTLLTFGDANNKVAYGYDALGRMASRTITTNGSAYTSTYGYAAGG